MLLRLLLFLLMMSGSTLATGISNASSFTDDDKAFLISSEQEIPRKDGLTDGIDHSDRNEQATLTNRSSTNRINNSRPQRLLPSNCQKPSRSPGRFGNIGNHRKLIINVHDSRRRQERAPYASAAPCEYYVFALRRILC
ncbi:MAG: hypothetical protein IKX36_06150 [Prevotella sp.]|nr:hypothetical protein [Prevotella sp.]